MGRIALIILLIPSICFGATSVTRHDITWNFADDETCGTFANGDPWCVGPISITSITPASYDSGSGNYRNGSMLFGTGHASYVALAGSQGYATDINLQGDSVYSHSLNVGHGVSVSSPLNITTGFLISTETQAHNNGRVVSSVSVLSVLSSEPSSGSFRPSIFGDGSIEYNKSQLDYEIFADLSTTPLTAEPSFATLEAHSAVFRNEVHPYIYQQSFLPTGQLNIYGGDIAENAADYVLKLNLNYTDNQKEQLFCNVVQLGLDYYASTQQDSENCAYEANGGHRQGRMLPMLIAGLALNHTDILDFLTSTHTSGRGEGQTCETMQEFQQHYYITQAIIDAGYFAQDDLGKAFWGQLACVAPSQNSTNYAESWSKGYQNINSDPGGGAALAIMIMGANSYLPDEAMLDYADRWESESGIAWNSASTPDLVEDMWDSYRSGAPYVTQTAGGPPSTRIGIGSKGVVGN